MFYSLGLLLDHLQDLRLTSVDDCDDGTPEVLSAGCTKVNVIAVEWKNVALAQHCVVLNEALVGGRNVAGEDHQLRFTAPQSLQGLVDAESVNTGFCDKAEAADDRFTRSSEVFPTHEKGRAKTVQTAFFKSSNHSLNFQAFLDRQFQQRVLNGC